MLSFFSFGILIFMILLSIEVPQRFSNGMAIDKMMAWKWWWRQLWTKRMLSLSFFYCPFSRCLCIRIGGGVKNDRRWEFYSWLDQSWHFFLCIWVSKNEHHLLLSLSFILTIEWMTWRMHTFLNKTKQKQQA